MAKSSSSSSSSLASNIYTGAADFGQFRATLGLIIAIFIAIIMIGFGVYLIFFNKPSMTLKATVQSIVGDNCEQTADKSLFACQVTVSFNYQGEQKTANITYTGPTTVKVGSIIDINYNPITDDVGSGAAAPTKAIGIGLIVVSLILVGVSYIAYWAARKYKFAAAAEGVAGAVGMLRQR